MTSKPESIWALGAKLGEAPVWVERDQALWFVDIGNCRIHRFDPENGERRSWEAPGPATFVLPAAPGDFIVGIGGQLMRFDPTQTTFETICEIERGRQINDATVDRQGRLWFGAVNASGETVHGAIYRLEGERCIAACPLGAITNGPAVSPDGRTLYHVETLAGIVHAATIDDAGMLTAPRELVRIPYAHGFPDGPVVDGEGCIWVAMYAGSRAHRYSPHGELLEVVPFPVSGISKLAFGGAHRRTVFATTANQHVTGPAKAREPQAGDLFRFTTDVAGQVAPAISA